MRVRSPLPVSVTRHDEKEQKLREFVRLHITSAAAGSSAVQGILMVVARSAESPVVKALAGLASEIQSAGYTLRIIFAHLDHDALPESWERDMHGLRSEVRWARRPRLVEAHEQLVLSPTVCWIGDCMRRDPAKCDAFEKFVEDCGEAAGCAAVSFERLWVISEPVRRLGPAAPVPSPEAIASLEVSQPTIGTRH
jgi:hypothetical protein